MKIVDKPWGKEVWIAHNDRYAGKCIFIKKGYKLSKQYHKKKHETMWFISGKAIIEVGDEIINYEQITDDLNCIITIPPNKIHRIEALEDTRLIEFSSPELDDVVRLEDDYGREDK